MTTNGMNRIYLTKTLRFGSNMVVVTYMQHWTYELYLSLDKIEAILLGFNIRILKKICIVVTVQICDSSSRSKNHKNQ